MYEVQSIPDITTTAYPNRRPLINKENFVLPSTKQPLNEYTVKDTVTAVSTQQLSSIQSGSSYPTQKPFIPETTAAPNSKPAESGGSAYPEPERCEDLTDNQDYKREDERLKTFRNWPLNFLTPKELAKNGFYYLGRGDEVRCAFCKVEIMRWEIGDDPADDHLRWAPQCPFLKMHASAGNVPVDSIASPGRDECGTSTPSVAMPRAIHPNYATETSRLNSFKDWPKSMRQKPEELAAAGFFYTGQGDKTKCFYCDGGLKDWEDNDIPWQQHALWFDRCAYVRLVKGKEYIQKVKTEACVIQAPTEETKTNIPVTIPTESKSTKTSESEISDAKLCKICYDENEELNIAFDPCGHVVACAKCALTTPTCPMCRTPIKSVIRLYYS